MNSKSSFFSRKNLLAVIACIAILYVLLWSVVLIKNKIDHNRVLQAIKAQEERIQNLSKEEKSIQKTVSYLMDSITLADTSERIFLSYLQRKFDLPKKLGADEVPIDLDQDLTPYPNQIHYLARIAYPNTIVNVPPTQEMDEDIKVTNINSANCDHLPLTDNFWPIMERSVAAGGYYTTHVALAFAMMKDNGCTLPPGAEDMKNRVVQDMAKLADDPSTIADLRYEAIAFLLLSERHDLVKSSWIDQIVTEQKEDGSWSREAEGAKSDHHSTLLALWSLLEYARSSTPDVPLIRRPD